MWMWLWLRMGELCGKVSRFGKEASASGQRRKVLGLKRERERLSI